MDPSQKPVDAYNAQTYPQQSPYSGYSGPAVVQGVSSSNIGLVGSTDPLNDPRIKYSETLCLSRAVAWFPLADMFMWMFLLSMVRAWWIFGLFMILQLSGIFAGKLMQRAWAYTYFGVLIFFVFLRFIFLIVVLAFAGRIGRFTGAIAVGILITIVF